MRQNDFESEQQRDLYLEERRRVRKQKRDFLKLLISVLRSSALEDGIAGRFMAMACRELFTLAQVLRKLFI